VARSKALELLLKLALNIVFPGSEHATDLVIANVKTLIHDDSYYQSITAFLQTVMSLGAWPLAPGSATTSESTSPPLPPCHSAPLLSLFLPAAKQPP